MDEGGKAKFPYSSDKVASAAARLIWLYVHIWLGIYHHVHVTEFSDVSKHVLVFHAEVTGSLERLNVSKIPCAIPSFLLFCKNHGKTYTYFTCNKIEHSNIFA
jgi:hypothetical protein